MEAPAASATRRRRRLHTAPPLLALLLLLLAAIAAAQSPSPVPEPRPAAPPAAEAPPPAAEAPGGALRRDLLRLTNRLQLFMSTGEPGGDRWAWDWRREIIRSAVSGDCLAAEPGGGVSLGPCAPTPPPAQRWVWERCAAAPVAAARSAIASRGPPAAGRRFLFADANATGLTADCASDAADWGLEPLAATAACAFDGGLRPTAAQLVDRRIWKLFLAYKCSPERALRFRATWPDTPDNRRARAGAAPPPTAAAFSCSAA
jgi:hypothetical protein